MVLLIFNRFSIHRKIKEKARKTFSEMYVIVLGTLKNKKSVKLIFCCSQGRKVCSSYLFAHLKSSN